MILCDSGFMVAALVLSDSHHKSSMDVLAKVNLQLITTWPCMTEAMYLTFKHGGQQALEGLRKQIERGVYDFHAPSLEDAQRACALMRQYEDAPMDFAGASLVVAAERLNIARILTFDKHFYAYRIYGGVPFDVIPEPR